MAKNKHTINDIQKALLSTTRYIKEEDELEKKEPQAKVVSDLNQQVRIDSLIMKKIKILAPYLGETTDEFVNKALTHYLRLKSLQFDQAIQKLTEE
ncbi:MAG: hypothetical protein PHE03_01565 [Bacteroidales bacterium]|nr:hypothetical protein [Bacteroidales bacterium]MDD3890972.1 hypothetical protein [Bacteroidales bacterium]